MWKSLVLGAMSVPCSMVAFALGWVVAGFRMGVVAGLVVLLVCWVLAAVTLLFTRRVSLVDVFLPIPIAIVWSLLMIIVSAGADVFTAPACIGSAILLSACLWMIRLGKLSVVWAVLPAIVFAYEMLPINIPGPFDDWFAFGGDITVLLWQGVVVAWRGNAVRQDVIADRRLVSLLVLGLWATVPGAARAQTAVPPSAVENQSQTPPPPAPATDVQQAAQADLDRVKQALQAPPVVRFDPRVLQAEARFYAVAHGREVTFEDLVGSFDLMNGPVPDANMTHEEFMARSAPTAMASYHITFGDVAEVAAINAGVDAVEKLVMKGIQAIREAKNAHEVQAIRAQIDKELAALTGQTIK